MQHRTEVTWETLLEADDGMQAQVVRLGAGMNVQGPDPKVAGGYYVFVGNGSIVHKGETLPKWSMVVVETMSRSSRFKQATEGSKPWYCSTHANSPDHPESLPASPENPAPVMPLPV